MCAVVQNTKFKETHDYESEIESTLLDELFSPVNSDDNSTYLFLKRVIDLIGSTVLILVAAPIMFVILIVVRASSNGPAIFAQRRLTKGGRIFYMYKFRTMRVGAEEDTGPTWATLSDPRVTKIGKFLRRSRLDELPQLFNVLRGEMSLVGPRPERPEIAARITLELPEFSNRLAVPAGITGLAQVSDGYAVSLHSYKRKLIHDVAYIKHRSLWLDLKILARTLPVILTGSGSR